MSVSKVFYSEKELDRMGLLSRSQRYRLKRKGEFPVPVVISQGRKAYVASEIDEWCQQKIKEGR